MDPITITALVTSAWNLLGPYAMKAAGKLVEKSGEKLPEVVVGKVWDAVKEKMESKPEAASLPAELIQDPQDEDLHGAFRRQLKKLLENDEAFAKQLQVLVKDAEQQGVSYKAELHGDGAIAQGNNARAVGKGGVYIGGSSTDSTIITGDNNSVNTGKKKG
jgi:hypothetical protein